MRLALGLLVASALVPTLACGARSHLQDGNGLGGGGAGSTTSSTGSVANGGGGSNDVAPPCGGVFDVGPVQELAEPNGNASIPQLVFGSDNGDVVSVFHVWQSTDPAPSALRVTTLEPWGSDTGARPSFIADKNGGYPFAVTNAAYGNVALASRHVDATQDLDSFGFVNTISATSPGEILSIDLDPSEAHPLPVRIVRGYDNPPVAFNQGYLAALVMWDATTPETDTHALKMAVGASGADVLEGLVSNDDNALACAKGAIAADAIRAGSSWIVASGSGSDLGPCDTTAQSMPTSLAIDQLVWGPPSDISWTLNRLQSIPGKDVIDAVHMAPARTDGGFIAVQRHGHSDLDLIRVHEDGSTGKPTSIASNGQTIAFSAITGFDGGVIVAFSTAEDPTAITFVLIDETGKQITSQSASAADAIGALSALERKDGGAALFAWGTPSSKIDTLRVDCGGQK